LVAHGIGPFVAHFRHVGRSLPQFPYRQATSGLVAANTHGAVSSSTPLEAFAAIEECIRQSWLSSRASVRFQGAFGTIDRRQQSKPTNRLWKFKIQVCPALVNTSTVSEQRAWRWRRLKTPVRIKVTNLEFLARTLIHLRRQREYAVNSNRPPTALEPE
jgi:hypothetical protein